MRNMMKAEFNANANRLLPTTHGPPCFCIFSSLLLLTWFPLSLSACSSLCLSLLPLRSNWPELPRLQPKMMPLIIWEEIMRLSASPSLSLSSLSLSLPPSSLCVLVRSSAPRWVCARAICNCASHSTAALLHSNENGEPRARAICSLNCWPSGIRPLLHESESETRQSTTDVRVWISPDE